MLPLAHPDQLALEEGLGAERPAGISLCLVLDWAHANLLVYRELVTPVLFISTFDGRQALANGLVACGKSQNTSKGQCF